MSSSSSSSPPPCSKAAAGGSGAAGKYCLCAPTTHPGSFRCRLHRSPVEDSKAATATATAPTSGADDQEAKKEAAAAAARALLERMVARKPRRQGVSATTFRPGPSRLGATTTAMDE